jgi:hypothetical protein
MMSISMDESEIRYSFGAVYLLSGGEGESGRHADHTGRITGE